MSTKSSVALWVCSSYYFYHHHDCSHRSQINCTSMKTHTQAHITRLYCLLSNRLVPFRANKNNILMTEWR